VVPLRGELPAGHSSVFGSFPGSGFVAKWRPWEMTPPVVLARFFRFLTRVLQPGFEIR